LKKDTTILILEKHGACKEAIEWVRGQDSKAEELWNCCERGDWLLWIAARLGVDRRYVVAAACACAQGMLHLVPEDEERPRKAIDTAIAWTQGKATIEQVRAAAFAAFAAAAYAAHAHADAATAVAAAVAAADAASDAASDAAFSDADAASDAAFSDAAFSDAAVAAADAKILRKCAQQVRKAIPWRLVEDRPAVRDENETT
jgi:hypothetical protein